MVTVVYGLIDPRNGSLRYIGQTEAPAKRYLQHLGQVKNRTHKTNWIKALGKLGLAPEMYIIEKHSTEAEALEAEIELIAYFRAIGCDLTNETPGGENPPSQLGKKRSHETKAKLRASHLGQTPPNKGKPHSEEARRKISMSGRGRRYLGRRKFTDQNAEMIRQESAQGQSYSALAKKYDVSKTTIAELVKRKYY